MGAIGLLASFGIAQAADFSIEPSTKVYRQECTYIRAYVPPGLAARLKPFITIEFPD